MTEASPQLSVRIQDVFRQPGTERVQGTGIPSKPQPSTLTKLRQVDRVQEVKDTPQKDADLQVELFGHLTIWLCMQVARCISAETKGAQ